MNPYYQYAIAKGYSNADAVIRQSSSKISPSVEEDIIKEGITDVYSPPTNSNESVNEDVSYVPRPTGSSPTETAPIINVSEPMVETVEPNTYTGDAQVSPIKEGTTINIFNPNGQTSTTTSAEDVSIDAGTGEIETGTDIGGGGFGGGGGMMGGGEDGAPVGAGKQAIVKTWIPLVVIAAGIAVIVLKPFKKAK